MACTKHFWKYNQHFPLLLSSPARAHGLTLQAHTHAGKEASVQASTGSGFLREPFGAHILSQGASTPSHRLQGRRSHLGQQPRRLPTTPADGKKGGGRFGSSGLAVLRSSFWLGLLWFSRHPQRQWGPGALPTQMIMLTSKCRPAGGVTSWPRPSREQDSAEGGELGGTGEHPRV